ncbi:MAG TPA: nucleotidyltransferase family protein [Gemmatimonadaceae bacterium]|nr:nucleotidyltransferase family protein [Gemmatimonadaceae bacterium]
MNERRPEYQLLLDCARVSLTGERRSRMNRTIECGIDWQLFLRTAHYHGMLPVVYLRLSETGVSVVPPTVMSWLRRSFQETTWRNTLLAGELTRVLDLLASHSIDAVPFKGPVLAALAYENVAMRQFGDLDLLVQPHERARTRELLLGDGYTMYDGWSHVDELNHEYTLVGTRGGVRLDVHWKLFPRAVLPVKPDRLRQQLAEVRIGDRTVRTFSPEDTLLILCVHADTHAWERLKWISDIARLVTSHPGLDWAKSVEIADSTGSERILLLGLRLADDLLGAASPEQVITRARTSRHVTRLANTVSERLFEPAATDVEADRDKSLLQLRSRDRLWHKLWLAATPNESDWEVMRLPGSLSALYYVIRPFRLLRKYGRRVGSALRDADG